MCLTVSTGSGFSFSKDYISCVVLIAPVDVAVVSWVNAILHLIHFVLSVIKCLQGQNSDVHHSHIVAIEKYKWKRESVTLITMAVGETAGWLNVLSLLYINRGPENMVQGSNV